MDPLRYGLDDPDRTFDIDGIIWTGEGHQEWTLENITSFLNSVYVGRIAYEYMDLPSKTERQWFAKLLESQGVLEPTTTINADKRTNIHALLAKSEVLDNFLQVKFPNLKRYGLEGGESMLPALDALFEGSWHKSAHPCYAPQPTLQHACIPHATDDPSHPNTICALIRNSQT